MTKYILVSFFLISQLVLVACKNKSETKNINPGELWNLKEVKESYKLSGNNLKALAEKILYKKTPQEDMYLYLLRPAGKVIKALPAIVYFTGGGWVNGTRNSHLFCM